MKKSCKINQLSFSTAFICCHGKLKKKDCIVESDGKYIQVFFFQLQVINYIISTQRMCTYSRTLYFNKYMVFIRACRYFFYISNLFLFYSNLYTYTVVDKIKNEKKFICTIFNIYKNFWWTKISLLILLFHKMYI